MSQQKYESIYTNIPKTLKAEIIKTADDEDRALANMIKVLLKEAMEARKATA